MESCEENVSDAENEVSLEVEANEGCLENRELYEEKSKQKKIKNKLFGISMVWCYRNISEKNCM